MPPTSGFLATKFKVGQSHKMYTFDSNNNSILSVKEGDDDWQNKLFGRYEDCFAELSQEIKNNVIACVCEENEIPESVNVYTFKYKEYFFSFKPYIDNDKVYFNICKFINDTQLSKPSEMDFKLNEKIINIGYFTKSDISSELLDMIISSYQQQTESTSYYLHD